jgi:hypothetical protein
VFHIPDASDIHGKTDSYRYPLAGTYDLGHPTLPSEWTLKPFPLGAKNAISRVCLVEFDTSSVRARTRSLVPSLTVRLASRDIHGNCLQWDSSPVVKYLQPSIQERFPWVEYIVRCGWTAPVPSPR